MKIQKTKRKLSKIANKCNGAGIDGKELPLVDKLKPLGINKGPGELVVLVYGVELVAGHLSKFPETEQIWDGVSNPRDMVSTHLKVIQS